MGQAGYEFQVIPSNIDESEFTTKDVSPCQYASKLALAKTKDVAERFADSVVIGADTIAEVDGEIIGKAGDATDAQRITEKLFSRPHRVITGVAVVKLSAGIELVQCDTTLVFPRKLTAQQIDEHVRKREWQDKAGAYAISENGDEFIERIEGSLTNVMGLPMELLGKMLAEIMG